MPDELKRLEFTLRDQLDGRPITPTNVDLPTLLDFLQDVERLVRGDKTSAVFANSRVSLEEGSLKVLPLVAALIAGNFEHEMSKLQRTGNLDEIQRERARVLSKWQAKAAKTPNLSYYIGGRGQAYQIKIASGNEYQHKGENAWVPVEKYLCGTLEEAGGKQSPNLHLSLPDTGELLLIEATKEQIGARKHQFYQTVTLLVKAEQHLVSRNLRKIQLLGFVEEQGPVDEAALQRLWANGSEAWRDVASASAWVEELRGE